jgi:hypothetical protein
MWAIDAAVVLGALVLLFLVAVALGAIAVVLTSD